MLSYMLATAAGLSALFVAVPVAYDLIRWAGAAYLLWLAYKVVARGPGSLTSKQLAAESPRQLYVRGFVTCALNPKVVVTYAALLPQFVNPDAGHIATQTVVLGLVQLVSAAAAHSVVILSASTVASILTRRHAFAEVQRFILGTVLAALAVRVLAERRGAV